MRAAEPRHRAPKARREKTDRDRSSGRLGVPEATFEPWTLNEVDATSYMEHGIGVLTGRPDLDEHRF